MYILLLSIKTNKCFQVQLQSRLNMKFNATLITAFLSAGALSLPTSDPDTEIQERGTSWQPHDAYIGMYAKPNCEGNGVKNGKRPKIPSADKCYTFHHNSFDNASFPYVKVDFGLGAWFHDSVAVFSGPGCVKEHYIGNFTKPEKKWTQCVNTRDRHSWKFRTNIGSVMPLHNPKRPIDLFGEAPKRVILDF